jgi:hypothetical protein
MALCLINRTQGRFELMLLHISFCWILFHLIIFKRMPEEKIPLGSLRHRWKDNIKMNLREIGWGGMDWVDRVASSCEHELSGLRKMLGNS